jgi:hypothetical protein
MLQQFVDPAAIAAPIKRVQAMHCGGDDQYARWSCRWPWSLLAQGQTGLCIQLFNLIAQDLAAGEGLALLDPHGDLAEAVLDHIPKERTNDLVYINPADVERPIGFNPLSRVPHDLKPLVADGIVSAFRHVWPEGWGPRLDYNCGAHGTPAPFRP